ncbi:maker568 [Drosophila busckii]|uniref:non-specific serine/threonine protein kinase n=1 Tax=Drosophila busckii TaxID=30019 RepID=A0A0M3QU25_DROBS|nr:casein kinase I [Drosophila busckii]ALC39923.1 maker568 [Drosophila busckii]
MFGLMNRESCQDEYGPLENYHKLYKIGSGTFGDIFIVENIKNRKRFALKLEQKAIRLSQLHFEFMVYRNLAPYHGIPRVYSFFSKPKFNAMLMDMQGPSLECLFVLCKNRFTMKTVLMLAVHVLHHLEYIHSKGYLHRDIKPDNFLIDVDNNMNQLYIIDFGLSKRYYDVSQMKHIPFKVGCNMTGTARFASINALRGHELSRRDDMESLGYMLLYFLNGSLPWQGLMQRCTQDNKYEIMAETKESLSPMQLFQGHPKEFSLYLQQCRELPFDAKPAYETMRSMFCNLFKNLKYVNDNIFDWDEQKKP